VCSIPSPADYTSTALQYKTDQSNHRLSLVKRRGALLSVAKRIPLGDVLTHMREYERFVLESRDWR
jgi:hypothetical protein